ncbi:hypothetical protein BT69DRAFT_1242909 [Atractiella rhizophila]|nr:hypothetical protein BT69DRAFT_1242909 [Atractiella rhizophila]
MAAKYLSVVVPALLTLLAKANAAVTPTGPAPGAVFKEGGDCTITWDADKTGEWTDLKIQLMNGDNFNMIPLETVVTGLDGTKSPGQYTWTCPDVNLNAPIFFYEFTNGAVETGEGNVFWTGRWTIADADGNSVAAPNTDKDGNGNPYNWGVTTLAGASSNSTTTTNSSNSTTASQTSSSSSTGNSAAPAETLSTGSSDEASKTTSTSSQQTTGSSAQQGSGTSQNDNSAANVLSAGIFSVMLAVAGLATL